MIKAATEFVPVLGGRYNYFPAETIRECIAHNINVSRVAPSGRSGADYEWICDCMTSASANDGLYNYESSSANVNAGPQTIHVHHYIYYIC
jgi:hypothetical protein